MKSIPTVTTLSAGVTGVTSPVIYIAGTSSKWETWWRKWIDYHDPVMECNGEGGNFKVYLTIDRGGGKTKLFFKSSKALMKLCLALI